MKTDFLESPALPEKLLRLLYPIKCIFCDDVLHENDNLRVCQSCYQLLPRLGRGFEPIPRIPYLNGLFACCHYEKDVEKAIHAMKFQNKPQFAQDLAYLLAEEMVRYPIPELDAIVPVPMHAKKLRQRGYNQSKLVAEMLSGFLGIPCAELLAKVRTTKAQSLLGREERLGNLENVFSLGSGKNPAGMRVLLLDDVTTTGTTLNACAKVLYDAETTAVFASVIAMAGN